MSVNRRETLNLESQGFTLELENLPSLETIQASLKNGLESPQWPKLHCCRNRKDMGQYKPHVLSMETFASKTFEKKHKGTFCYKLDKFTLKSFMHIPKTCTSPYHNNNKTQ